MKSLLFPICLILSVLVFMSCGTEKKDFIDRMETEHENDRPTANASASETSLTELVTDTVEYAVIDGEGISGFMAKPKEAEGALPGLLVIHEWWGLNDNIRMMTRRLAGEGYVALAVDLYNGKTAETTEDAGRYARAVDQQQSLTNLNQAYSYLSKQEGTERMGVIGWCFGGGWSLQAALAMPEKIDATVIYYGRLVTDAQQLRKLDMPVLGIFGSEDEGIPPEEVRKFESALNEAGINNFIQIYEGADHAFANPSGNRYEKESAEDAWNKTVAFLSDHLKE